VEVHIEQGPVLEARNQPLGVVTAINGQSFFRVEVFGEAGHAGTVPMALRRDALAGCADIALLLERLARESDGLAGGTVGRLPVEPGSANVIPDRAVLSVDIRAGSDDTRMQLVEKFKTGCRDIGARRRLTVTVTPTHEVPSTPCDPKLRRLLGMAIGAV